MRAILGCMLIVLLCLTGGCADPNGGGKSYWQLVRSYSNALTRNEQKQAMTELQGDKQRQQELLKRNAGAE